MSLNITPPTSILRQSPKADKQWTIYEVLSLDNSSSRATFPIYLDRGHAVLHIFNGNTGDIDFAAGWLSREKFRLDGRVILNARRTSLIPSSSVTTTRSWESRTKLMTEPSARRASTWWRNFSRLPNVVADCGEAGKFLRAVERMIRIGTGRLSPGETPRVFVVRARDTPGT